MRTASRPRDIYPAYDHIEKYNLIPIKASENLRYIDSWEYDSTISNTFYVSEETGQTKQVSWKIPVNTKLAEGISWLLNTYQKLESFRTLKAGWDSYDAEAPNEKSIVTAEKIIRILYELNYEPTRIVPSVDGGIVISFFEGDLYADIECLNSGEILAVESNSYDQPEPWIVYPDHGNIKSTVGRIRDFFNS